ncbi:hypothetical protein QYE76_033598 [Lolium multiflorum]|uniref:CCHC-type domain-containing protein n=1 Tax=Lolium multiflorum TaxID=4521 RepID=A0AAD8QWY9_LOLMU|nr:hypothetical protein QYE76_033598 [Lolium multiflorum]
MDKKIEISEGKKKMGEGSKSGVGENMTPLSRLVVHRPAGRTGMPPGAGSAPSGRKLMAAAIAAGGGDKNKLIPRENKAPEDEEVLLVDFSELKKGMKNPWMIVGRYNSKKMFNTAGLFARMRHLWQLQGYMEEKGIGEKRFLIVLEKEGDLKHILKGGPWTYLNDAFLVTEYDGVSSAREVPVDVMPIWVRIHDLPIPMMTQEWAENIGKKFFGPVREVGKDNRGHVWASFLRIRIEHKVDKPIRRWIPIAGKEGGKTKRYEVKYEGAPFFCFYCGIFGHNERNCLLPEEEKMVRFCEEQRASPFKHSENRSYYVPAEDKNTKRSLHFSPMSSGWKVQPESETKGAMSACKQLEGNVGGVGETEEAEETLPNHLQEVLAVAVTNLKMNEEREPAMITNDQINKATEAIKVQMAMSGKNKIQGRKRVTITGKSRKQKKQSGGGSASGYGGMEVPNILDCLREDGSMYEELKGGAVLTASAFLKKKNQVLGKRMMAEESFTDDTSQNFVIRFRGTKERKSQTDLEASGEVVQQTQEEGKEAEATSPGAAGQLTGAEERACQKP